MKRRSVTDQLGENLATATAKVRLWGSRAEKARQAGRKAYADRCDDKVRDWASKARQIERTQSSETSPFQDARSTQRPALLDAPHAQRSDRDLIPAK